MSQIMAQKAVQPRQQRPLFRMEDSRLGEDEDGKQMTRMKQCSRRGK
jgi:hypothetical protein